MDGTYWGEGCKDQNGVILKVGDQVRFLGEDHNLILIKWDGQDHENHPKRVSIGKSCFWLTPDTANNCIRIADGVALQKLRTAIKKAMRHPVAGRRAAGRKTLGPA
jgi:hypothetical protein